MTRFLFFLLIVLYLTLNQSVAYAACDQIDNIEISPTSGSTSDNYTFTVKLSSTLGGNPGLCPTTNNSAGIKFYVDNPANGYLQSTSSTIDSSGNINFSTKLPAPGNWSFIIQVDNQTLTSGKSITVSGNNTTRCGDEVPAGFNQCPTNCPAKQSTNGLWYCGGDLSRRCVSMVNPGSVKIALGTCKDDLNSYSNQYASTCHAANGEGRVCADSSYSLCINGASGQVPQDVICQKAKTPPPTGTSPTGAIAPTMAKAKGTGQTCDLKNGKSGWESEGVETAIGCIPTNPSGLITAITRLLTGVGGGIALLLMIFGAFRMITSQGNPDAIKEGSEQFTSALIGLLFIVFAVLLLKIIGVDILNLPNFGT